MKKKIAILGSTGSIGKSLLKIIYKERDNFEIELLTANKNFRELINQTKKFKVKNVIISDPKSLSIFKKKNQNKNINVYGDYSDLNKIFKKKIDYTMISIVGLQGLEPTLKMIKYSKNIAIANKESIICGWNLIKKNILKYKSNFIPVDSEHFSIWYAMKNINRNLIKKIYLTASGGPFLDLPFKMFNKISIHDALNHPNWKMGKKISVDSSTMMNKVFELIEAKKIFDINYHQLSIIVHPQSYIHAILEFNNGLIKLIAHNTNMMIPIFNSLNESNKILNFYNQKIDIKKLNNLELREVDKKKYPLTQLINKMPKKNSLFETILVSANDALVNNFLNKKIKFKDISKILLKFMNNRDFNKYKYITPKNVKEIIKLNDYVRFKIQSKVI